MAREEGVEAAVEVMAVAAEKPVTAEEVMVASVEQAKAIWGEAGGCRI